MSRAMLWLKATSWGVCLKGDLGISIILFLLGVASRVPFQSKLLYHWDSVNFALGMKHFDVRLHQPHPPGYFFYILLGRLVGVLTEDANASLVWMSVLFGSLTVLIVYWLGRRLFTRTEALIAAVFALTSPAFWFYSEVALTYIVEAFFVTAIVLVSFETLNNKTQLVWLSAVLLGLAGGIRQTTLILMLPLWIYSLRYCPWRYRLFGIVVLISIVAVWGIPTVILTGGLDPYIEASRSIGNGVLMNLEFWDGGLAVISPFARLGVYVMYGLMLGAVPILYVIIRSAIRIRAYINAIVHDHRFLVLVLWLVPNLIFYAPLVRAPGHTMSFMPALVLLAAVALKTVSQAIAIRFSQPVVQTTRVATILLAFVNVAFFLVAPPYLFNTRRVITTTPSWATIQYRDQYLAERITYVQKHFDAATTLILTTGPDYRHPDYYLRDYLTLNYAGGGLISSVPPDKLDLVFFSEDLRTQHIDGRTMVLPSGEQLISLPLPTMGEIVVRDYEVFVYSKNARK